MLSSLIIYIVMRFTYLLMQYNIIYILIAGGSNDIGSLFPADLLDDSHVNAFSVNYLQRLFIYLSFVSVVGEIVRDKNE